MTTCRRYSIGEYVRKLCAAVELYNYPKVTYDFVGDKETCHPTMRKVEEKIRAQLLSEDLKEVKDGLSNVLYWGYATQLGRQHDRTSKFRAKVTPSQIECFEKIASKLKGPGLLDIKGINMPEFSMMPFVSKSRMFLDPDNYPVLDNRIADNFAQSPCFPPLEDLRKSQSETTIRISGPNEQVYENWAKWCRDIADLVNSHPASPCKDLRAVDVERAIFQLSQWDKQMAWRLLKDPKPDAC